MCTKAISQSRHLIAQSKKTRASVKHLIETTQQIIRDSQRLIQRATQTRDSTMMGSAGPAKPEYTPRRNREAARANRERSPRAQYRAAISAGSGST
jgi:hypothetical protein